MYPIHLNFFGNLKGFYEGIYFAMAVAIAIQVAFRLARNSGVDKDSLMLLLMVALVSGVIGGSLFQQFFYTGASGLKDIISDWDSGFSITGAVILGPIFTYLYCRWQKLNYWKLFALVVPAIILGQAFGRVGCFMNGDGHGTVTELPWAMSFPRYGHEVPSFELKDERRYESDAWKYSVRNGLVASDASRSASVHPTQLYEILADLVLFALLLQLLKKVQDMRWTFKLVPLAYIGGYAFIRFWIEFLRADRELAEGAILSQMQWSLLVAMLGSLLFFIFYWSKPDRA